MTKTNKLSCVKVNSFPDVLHFIHNDYAKGDIAVAKSCLALAVDNRYVINEKGEPLLLIWAYRPTLLSPYLELNMIATKYLSVAYVRECREILWEWVDRQTVPVYARCDSAVTGRFLKFMGLTKVNDSYGVYQYEAIRS